MSASPSELIASYRLHAANCIEIARDLEPDRKLALLNIAQAWLNLAEQIAKISTPSWSMRPPSARPTSN